MLSQNDAPASSPKAKRFDFNIQPRAVDALSDSDSEHSVHARSTGAAGKRKERARAEGEHSTKRAKGTGHFIQRVHSLKCIS